MSASNQGAVLNEPRPSCARRVLFALFLYSVLTVLLTRPLAFNLHSMGPGDPAQFTWSVGWTVHALKTNPLELPHGNIFHPLDYALGLGEPVLGTTLLVLPLALFTDDAVLLFNVARLLTFLLSAFTAYLFAKDLGCGEAAALIAGAAFGFSPIRTDPLSHLNSLGTHWLPLVLLFLHRFARSGRRRHALLAAAFFVLEALACGYHAVLAALVLPAAAVPLFWRRWKRLPNAALAMIIAAACLLPLYLLHRAALGPLEYARDLTETTHYSATLETFLAVSPWNWLYGDLLARFRGHADNLFPGLVPPLLILVAASSLLRNRQWPSRDALALFGMALAAALVALGPVIQIGSWTLGKGPFGVARDLLPVFTMIRVPSRAGVFIALGLALLLGRALSRLRWGPIGLSLVAGLVLVEAVKVPIPMPSWYRVIDSRQPPPGVYRWLAEQAGDFAVVELPMLSGEAVFERPAYHETIYMVRSTHHWKRLVNGYTGVEPPYYVELRGLARRFPTQEFLDAVRALGVRYIILHRGAYGPLKRSRFDRELPRFSHELSTTARFPEENDVVLELVPR